MGTDVIVCCPDSEHNEIFNKVLTSLLSDGLAKSSFGSTCISTNNISIYFLFEKDVSSCKGVIFTDASSVIKYVKEKEGVQLV